MKAKMPDEEEVPLKLLGDNLEQLIFEINEFCNSNNSKPGAEIPQTLENYLKYVAKTGNTVFPWSVVKNLYRTKMLSAIASFSEEPCPNEAFVLERFDLFRAAPFTVQRLTELIIQPNKHYKKKEKFLRGLEKTVLVVTTVEPKPLNATSEEINNESNDDSSMPWLTSVTSDSESTLNQFGNNHRVLGDTTNTATLTTSSSVMTVMPSHSGTTDTSSGELQPSSSSTLGSTSLNIHRVVTTEGSAGEVSIEKSSNSNSFGDLSDSESSSLSLSGVMIVDGARGEEGDVTKSLASSSSLGQSESGISDTVMPMNIDYNINIGEGGDNIESHATNYSIDTTTTNNNDGMITHVNLNQLDASNNSITQSSSSLIFTETECINGSTSSSTTTPTATSTVTPTATSDLTVTTVYPQISSNHDDDDDGSSSTLLTDEIVPETIPILTDVTHHQNLGELTNIDSTTSPVNTKVPLVSDSKIDLSEISTPSEVNLIAIENTTTELVSSVIITDTETPSELKQGENEVENDNDDDDDDDEESFEFIENDAIITCIADDSEKSSVNNTENNLESPHLQELVNPTTTTTTNTTTDVNDTALNVDPVSVSNSESESTKLSTLPTNKTEEIEPTVVQTEETTHLISTPENDKSASNTETSQDNAPVSLG